MSGPVGQPLRAGASVIDILGAVFGLVAAQAALRERDQTGVGHRVGSALFESAAFLMSTRKTATGLEARPMPARPGAWAIYEVFKTSGDGQRFIGVISDQQWARFVEEFAVGLSALPMEFGSARDRPGIRRQPPRMGEHSREVLREAGHSVNEIENLIGAGTVVAWGE